jgi:acyl-CoA synthetase (AMP-forming)/AMP-acid ligase II
MSMGQHRFEYHKDRAKTDASYKDGFFTVGDAGYLSEDGFLFLCDRKSDMIISGGVNIYPAEIEAVLGAHPGVGDVAVFGVPDDDWGERVLAVVEPAEGSDAGAAARRGDPGLRQGSAGEVQVAALDRLHRRAAARPQRQALQAKAARSLLGGARSCDMSPPNEPSSPPRLPQRARSPAR